jgi:DNA polymerase-3 subunit epsilon
MFDVGFLSAKGLTFTELPCPMLLSTPLCKLPSVREGYKWPKVQEAYDFFFPGNEYVEEHRGADDAMHEAEIVYELYNRKVFKL